MSRGHYFTNLKSTLSEDTYIEISKIVAFAGRLRELRLYWSSKLSSIQKSCMFEKTMLNIKKVNVFAKLWHFFFGITSLSSHSITWQLKKRSLFHHNKKLKFVTLPQRFFYARYNNSIGISLCLLVLLLEFNCYLLLIT